MKKIALIGSKGFLGRHFEKYLTDCNYEVRCYDIVSSQEENYCQIDVLKKADCEKINYDVDFVYVFAGLTGTKVSFEQYETFTSANELGLNNILNAISHSPYRPRVVFPSSRLVYKGSDKALKEDAKKETKTIYSVNKLACEGLLSAYSCMFDMPYTIFRICVPFGNLLSKDYSFGTIGFFLRQAKSQNRITLYGKGDVKRTFTSMSDLCSQIELTLKNEQSTNQIFNIGGCSHSLREVASLIADHCRVSLEFIPYPDSDMRIESGSTFFDSSKIEELTRLTSYQDIETLFKI